MRIILFILMSFVTVFSLLPGSVQGREMDIRHERVPAPMLGEDRFRAGVTFNKDVISSVPKFTGGCPEGQLRFFIEWWDTTGFCGTLDDNYCLPHFVYVLDPSVSECGMFWVVDGNAGSIGDKDIIGGYACVRNIYDPVFTNPPPAGATCPPGSHMWEYSNELQYRCVADQHNQHLQPSCIGGYSEVDYSCWGSGEGCLYFFVCGLNGFKYDYQNQNRFESCRTSGAQSIGGSGGVVYCCAYTEDIFKPFIKEKTLMKKPLIKEKPLIERIMEKIR